MRSIKEVRNLKRKRVLVRVDFNVPILSASEGERKQNRAPRVHLGVADDTRIAAATPTIKWLTKKGAKVILMSHYGRPHSARHPERSEGSRTHVRASAPSLDSSRRGGRDSSAYGLRMTAIQLGVLLKKKVQVVEEWDFKKIGKVVKKMKTGGVLMLPNLRLNPGEEANKAEFAKELAGLADVFVNEAFSVCHRAHASIVGVPEFLPAYAGLRLEEEVRVLSDLVRHPKRPLVVMIGGAKITDKIGVIKNFVHRASAVLVGGAPGNHFFKAMGYGVGASPIDKEGLRLAKSLLKNKKIVLPKDVVVGTRDGKKVQVVEIQKSKPFAICHKPYAILDIGPRTITHFSHWIRAARTLIWNGPMGAYERKEFSYGTAALAQLFAARARGRAFGVIGGGETIDALRQTGMMEYVDFVSTGGGAMLEFLSGKTLPVLTALYGAR